MRYLTVDDCVALNRRYSTGEASVERPQALRTAVFMPQCRFKDADTFTNAVDKAAILGHLIIELAPFVEANTLTARAAVHRFLQQNGVMFDRTAAEQTWPLVELHQASVQSMRIWLRLHVHDVHLMPLQVMLVHLNRIATVVAHRPVCDPEVRKTLDRAGAAIIRQLVETFELPAPLWRDLSRGMDAMRETWGDELQRAL
jgi:prophage maintenance system killer protein